MFALTQIAGWEWGPVCLEVDMGSKVEIQGVNRGFRVMQKKGWAHVSESNARKSLRAVCHCVLW